MGGQALGLRGGAPQFPAYRAQQMT
jgi:hypothetical protein